MITVEDVQYRAGHFEHHGGYLEYYGICSVKLISEKQLSYLFATLLEKSLSESLCTLYSYVMARTSLCYKIMIDIIVVHVDLLL